MSQLLSVREIEERDIDFIIQYWLQSDELFLKQLGVDVAKLPTDVEWRQMLTQQIETPISQKKSYCLIWQLDEHPIGHCNVNPLTFGAEAYMHLHLWSNLIRRQGSGIQLLKMSLPYFFNNLKLQRLYCLPYALNAAPNSTLAKAGFEFIKEYVTTPGSINFEQPVKKWQMTLDQFNKLTEFNINSYKS